MALIIVIVIVLAAFGTYFAFSTISRDPNSCVQSAGSQIFLAVLSDTTNTPVQGASVNGNVKWLCGSSFPPGYFVASSSIGNLVTSSNGTVSLGQVIGNYSLTVSYSGHKYPVQFSPGAEQVVNVTLFVPSARLTVMGCPFGSTIGCFNET
jgi:hypothetical protein